ncbi:MAG TPA: hypothetical protein VEA80_20365 [Vitreimonas sp.]|uniref:hypothetical protein n=1 Tax=Vitreimonas sp. TaxID=3069702 RepID=UPI002D3A9C15|nr:hypothetical protein [Vitreimonas sp.]HYD89845.1 hypothetical protein [Vitreimonas sp.]
MSLAAELRAFADDIERRLEAFVISRDRIEELRAAMATSPLTAGEIVLVSGASAMAETRAIQDRAAIMRRITILRRAAEIVEKSNDAV